MEIKYRGRGLGKERNQTEIFLATLDLFYTSRKTNDINLLLDKTNERLWCKEVANFCHVTLLTVYEEEFNAALNY